MSIWGPQPLPLIVVCWGCGKMQKKGDGWQVWILLWPSESESPNTSLVVQCPPLTESFWLPKVNFLWSPTFEINYVQKICGVSFPLEIHESCICTPRKVNPIQIHHICVARKVHDCCDRRYWPTLRPHADFAVCLLPKHICSFAGHSCHSFSTKVFPPRTGP